MSLFYCETWSEEGIKACDSDLKTIEITSIGSTADLPFDWDEVFGIRSMSLEIHNIENIEVAPKKGISHLTVTMRHQGESLDSPMLETNEDGQLLSRIGAEWLAKSSTVTITFTRNKMNHAPSGHVAPRRGGTTAIIDLLNLARFYLTRKFNFRLSDWGNFTLKERHLMTRHLLQHQFKIIYLTRDGGRICKILVDLRFFMLPVETMKFRLPKSTPRTSTLSYTGAIHECQDYRSKHRPKKMLSRMYQKMRSVRSRRNMDIKIGDLDEQEVMEVNANMYELNALMLDPCTAFKPTEVIYNQIQDEQHHLELCKM